MNSIKGTLSSTSSAIFSTRDALLVWYGICFNEKVNTEWKSQLRAAVILKGKIQISEQFNHEKDRWKPPW